MSAVTCPDCGRRRSLRVDDCQNCIGYLRSQLSAALAKMAELERQLRWSREHEEDVVQENDNLRASARTALEENARLRREVEAKDACWHCKVCLLPTKPRCETCDIELTAAGEARLNELDALQK